MTRTPTGGERLAAVIATIALLGALAVIAVGIAANWASLLLSLAAFAVTVVSGWYVVSRRGARRVIASVTALVGLGLLCWGLAITNFSGQRIAAVLVLGLISFGAARIALHRTRRALQQEAAARTQVPPARRPVLIMNPKSGGGKATKFNLVEECKQRGIEPVVLTPGDDLVQLAENAIADGADAIGMAGGDGSQALVATVAIRHGVPLVVVPAGTRNHFALDLGLNRADVVGALDAFNDGVERRIDLATVNGRVFVNNASLGLYAKIVQSPDYRGAKRQTTLDMLPDLLGPDSAPLDLRFYGPDGSQYPTAQMVLVSNNAYELDRLAGRGTRERLDGGVLGIVAARISNAAEASQFAALNAAGHVAQFPGWLEWTAPSFRIDSTEPIEIGVDGEALVMEPPLQFAVMPGVLRIRLPRHASGRSPAARAVHLVSRSTFAELGRVAAGRAAA